MISDTQTRCTGRSGDIVGLHRSERTLCDWRAGYVRILVRESWILPGTAAILWRLPWLPMIRVVLLVLPCTHRGDDDILDRGMLSRL